MGVVFGSEKNSIKLNVIEENIIADSYILDYIGSTGTQYINTKYNPTVNTNIELTFKSECSFYQGNGGNYAFFGSTDTQTNFILVSNFGGGLRQNAICNWFGKAWNFGYGNRINAFDTIYYDIVNSFVTIRNEKTSWYVNNHLIGDNQTVEGENSSYPMYILGENNNGVAKPFDLHEFYVRNFKIKNNSELKHNFIPIIKDNIIQMYDTITNTYFTNQGTGKFIGGNIVGYVKDGIAYNMDGTTYTGN